jgi:SAM-dependent methyltransferase
VVVDVGSGRGEAAAYAARRGARTIAADVSVEALGLVRATAEAAGVRVSRVVAEGPRLPVASSTADRVLLLDVVEHLEDEALQGLLEETGRILRPAGYVVVHTLPNRWALGVAYPALRTLARGLPAEPRSEYERVVHVSEQDPIRLRRCLSAAGLEHRVWVEEWTTRQALRSSDRSFPDRPRAVGYPVLRRPLIRRLARLAVRTPLRWLVVNDVFAVAWPVGGTGPRWTARFRPL